MADAEAGFRPKRPGPRPVVESDQDDENLRRIEFLRSLTSAPAVVGLPPALLGGPRSSSGGTHSRPVIPHRIGPEDVHQVTQIANVFRAADHAGHPVASEAMAAQLQHALRLLEAKADRGTKTAMQIAVGRLANVIGWSQFDAGCHWEADQYFRVGLRYAEQAGAWWLRADVLTHMARQAVYLDRADDALTLIGTAKIREDQLSSLRRSSLCIVEARAFSEIGEAREAARSVDRAVQFFYEVDDRDDPDWELYSEFFSEAQLNGDTGHGLWAVAVHGLETANAVQRLSAAIDSYPDRYARSRLFCVARLAALSLHQGDPDEGVDLGQKALAASREVRSMRVLDDLGEVHRATTRLRHSHTGVAALRRDIAMALGGRNYKELSNA
ncbi:hypothetical protein AB0F43_31345 [Kribbella sp. NPDC023972]|uniref:hypothetical protein n=1 Tax=Kribbella sp. NPDC023972 TaxID=3154795 RepID=UPI0033C30D32